MHNFEACDMISTLPSHKSVSIVKKKSVSIVQLPKCLLLSKGASTHFLHPLLMLYQFYVLISWL